jgi:uroporphyrin-III C-methyltransferase
MKLTLVGAGPGDADLITLKGIKALQRADAILYDALVNEEILDFAPPHIPKVFVGKRFGTTYLSQEEINTLIVEYALQYDHVVRLKGGDSFVFGRGMEEILYAQTFGIDTEVIAGVSSALGVPASLGIPMTHRGASESFWVLTGTTQKHQLSTDIALACQSKATIVILMGMHHLADIVTIFEQAGKAETPIAIIQNGTLPAERVVVGKIHTIVQKAEEQAIGSPAIIVIGEVVSTSPTFSQLFAHYFIEK